VQRVAAIIVAAGSGERFGDPAKVLTSIGGKPMLLYSLETLKAIEQIAQVIVVAGAHTSDDVRALVNQSGTQNATVCQGGAARQDSVRAGLESVGDDIEFVLVHDGARPFADVNLMCRVMSAAFESGAAVPAISPADTLYSVDEQNKACGVVDRRLVRLIQTPQVARRDWLTRALGDSSAFTDEGSALIASGYPVTVVVGNLTNIKITYSADVRVAEAMVSGKMT
jgi:2-C-methyl-D-erythritol 4-phosphate cytidylyltransferase